MNGLALFGGSDIYRNLLLDLGNFLAGTRLGEYDSKAHHYSCVASSKSYCYSVTLSAKFYSSSQDHPKARSADLIVPLSQNSSGISGVFSTSPYGSVSVPLFCDLAANTPYLVCLTHICAQSVITFPHNMVSAFVELYASGNGWASVVMCVALTLISQPRVQRWRVLGTWLISINTQHAWIEVWPIYSMVTFQTSSTLSFRHGQHQTAMRSEKVRERELHNLFSLMIILGFLLVCYRALSRGTTVNWWDFGGRCITVPYATPQSKVLIARFKFRLLQLLSTLANFFHHYGGEPLNSPKPKLWGKLSQHTFSQILKTHDVIWSGW